jgi:hypothetical protein
VPESDLTSSFEWYNISFSQQSSLNPDQGLCLTLTSRQNPAPARIVLEAGGVFGEPDSAMITGDAGGWTAFDINSSLRYRIHAVCITGGEINIEPGSWRQVPSN